MGGWQEYSVADGGQAVKGDPAAAPLSTYLGVLGMPGLTAYASMVKLAAIQPGQSRAGVVGRGAGRLDGRTNRHATRRNGLRGCRLG